MLNLFAGAGVLAALAPIVFSIAGLGSGVLLLAVGALAAAWFGFRRLAVALVVVAVLQVAAGLVYRAGEDACRVKVEAAIAAERERQRLVGAGVLAELERRLEEAAAADQVDAARISEFERELAARPAIAACILDQRDAEAINGKR